jgi:hypothetical protein
VAARGGGDDFVRIGGPDEGLWLPVMIDDEAVDRGLKIDDASTIRARQTCFWGLLRSSTITCRRLRSIGFKWTVMPVRILKTRTPANSCESHKGLLCRHQSTRAEWLAVPV